LPQRINPRLAGRVWPVSSRSNHSKTICNIGDVAHHVVLFEHPKIEVGFDSDSKQGVQSRMKLFDMLSADRPACQIGRRLPIRANADAACAVVVSRALPSTRAVANSCTA
jgi:hypothetical protein